MAWRTKITRADDPCLARYPKYLKRFKLDQTAREIHVNLHLNKVRVYIRSGSRVRTFGPIIWGPATKDMARKSTPLKWCHIHEVTGKNLRTKKKGLLNFVLVCTRREIGFHSDMWYRNGRLVRIPGTSSDGCIRIPHAQSRKFFNLVRKHDPVRFYEQNFWRPPLFAKGKTSKHCRP